MGLRFGVGERVGPFWAGVSMSPRRHFDNNPNVNNLTDVPSFGCGCAVAILTIVVGFSVAVVFLVGFLVLLL
jgi:hypothetical protein